jgi:shikimate dehydrogenase
MLRASEAASAAGKQVLIGLVGQGIQLSRTPAMHEAEGRARGMVYIYRLIDPDLIKGAATLAELLTFAEHFGFDGLNVTFPYKQAVLPLLDELSESAQALGSVNTVVFRGGRRFGHNTDMWGFAESFRRGLPDVPRDRVLLLGAGGAGVAHALLDCGVGTLLVADKDSVRATTLARRLVARFGDGRAAPADEGSIPAADGIVNATPVGMAKLPGTPIDPAVLQPTQWVADIIYFPLETELLAAARERGCRTLSGEGMAIYQAARAFELFTGVAPDIGRMRAAFNAYDE